MCRAVFWSSLLYSIAVVLSLRLNEVLTFALSVLSKASFRKLSRSSKCLSRAALFADELLKQEQEQEQARLNEARKISVVNVNPTNIRPHSDTPEIRKYKKRFNSEILCAALWGETQKHTHNTNISHASLHRHPTTWPLCVCVCRSESAGRDGERPDAVGSKRSGQSLQSDQSTALPADGRSGGTQCSGHHLRLVRLLSPSNMHNS